MNTKILKAVALLLLAVLMAATFTACKGGKEAFYAEKAELHVPKGAGEVVRALHRAIEKSLDSENLEDFYIQAVEAPYNLRIVGLTKDGKTCWWKMEVPMDVYRIVTEGTEGYG